MSQLDRHCAVAWWFHQARMAQLSDKLVSLFRQDDWLAARRLAQSCYLTKNLARYKAKITGEEFQMACQGSEVWDGT